MIKAEKRCKLCNGKLFYKFSLPLAGGLEGAYFECSTCRMLQSQHLDELTPLALESITRPAPEIDLDSGAAWRLSCLATRVEQLVKLNVLPRASPSFNVLDFGCGTGFLVSYLAHRFGWNTIGYDPFCTPAYGRNRAFADWEAVAQRGPYHLVIASEVFEHFIQPRPELARIRAVLAKEGACLYVTTGYYEPGKSDASWNYLAPQSGHHVSFFGRQTMEEVARYLSASGLYQPGASYEWLFVFGKTFRRRLKKLELSGAMAFLRAGARLGLLKSIE